MGKGGGKKQHSKDLLYLTHTEWKTEGGGFKEKTEFPFRCLPFNCCALTLLPFQDPVATPDGTVFDIKSIIPYIKKYKRNPATGEPLTAKDLLPLRWHKNAEGDFHCPITFKVFTNHSHIVAIRTSGNVFSYDAISELNFKNKNWTDLLTGEAFKRSDVLTLQDPTSIERRNIENFNYIKEGLAAEVEEKMSTSTDAATKRILEDLPEHLKDKPAPKRQAASAPEASKKPKTSTQVAEESSKTKTVARPQAGESSGRMAASFTSSVMRVVTTAEKKVLTDKDIAKKRYERVKKYGKKGYVRLHTNYGDLNLELHCDMTPKTCENFLLLCERGYYKNTIFHRSIRNFMLQGGDPTGTGTGGQSAFGDKFEDEFHPKLTHSERGQLSMANSGPGTNGSQFFITFKSCHHLDNKHSVFGRLVGGMELLRKLELIPTDDDDRPTKEIMINDATVFVNPFSEVDALPPEEEDNDNLMPEVKTYNPADELKGSWYSNPTSMATPLVAQGEGVGKYLKSALQSIKSAAAAPESTEPTTNAEIAEKAAKPKGRGFDFSGW